MNGLIENIDKLHTTEMGVERIKKNLQLETDDIVQWCKIQILDKDAKMKRMGKNWYVTVDDCRITVNAYSYTILLHIKLRHYLIEKQEAGCWTYKSELGVV